MISFQHVIILTWKFVIGGDVIRVCRDSGDS